MIFLSGLDAEFASIGFYNYKYYMVFCGVNEAEDEGYYFTRLEENIQPEDLEVVFFSSFMLLSNWFDSVGINPYKINWNIEKQFKLIESEDEFEDLMIDKYLKVLNFKDKPNRVFQNTKLKFENKEGKKLLSQFLCFIRVNEYIKVCITNNVSKELEKFMNSNYNSESVELLYSVQSSLSTFNRVLNYFEKFHKKDNWFLASPKMIQLIKTLRIKKNKIV